jgi:hypothetical protein
MKFMYGWLTSRGLQLTSDSNYADRLLHDGICIYLFPLNENIEK